VIDADLSSFDQLAYKQGLATYVGVPTQNVQLLVSQASVRVDARITPTETLTIVAIAQRLAQIQDAASATAQLNMPVESVVAPVIVPALNSPLTPPPPQPGLDMGDGSDVLSGEDGALSGGGVAGLVIGLLLVLALAVFSLLILRMRRRKQQEQKDVWQPRFFPAADMSDVKSDTIELMVDDSAMASGHPDGPYTAYNAAALSLHPAGLSSWPSSGSGFTLMSARNARSRAPHPQYPERCLVSDDQVSWSVPFPSYRPARFTHPDVLLADRTVSPDGWADPADPRKISDSEWKERFSYEQSSLTFDCLRRPRNPVGRTGVEERGLLECWGPNHRVDPVITRFDPGMPEELQVLAVRQACRSRDEWPEWAICGGVLEPGDRPYAAAKRVFVDEVLPKLAQQLSPVQVTRFNELVDKLFEEQGQAVYCGYFDAAHNTDNAWIESTAFHFHCSSELGALVALHATEEDNDDSVSWLDVCALHDMAASHPSQQQWLDLVSRRMLRRDPSAQTDARISPTSQLHRVIPTQPPVVARHSQLQPAGEDEGRPPVAPACVSASTSGSNAAVTEKDGMRDSGIHVFSLIL